MKAELAKAGKPSSFATLNKNGRLPQKLLVAGYDKYSAYDLAWQSYHVTAAAACRGGSGPVADAVMVRNTRDKLSCNQICGRSSYGHCDAEVSVAGKSARLHGMASSWAIFTTTLVAMQITGNRRRPLLTMALCSSSFVVSAVAGGKMNSFCGIFKYS